MQELSKLCPACRQRNAPSAQFCQGCGLRYTDALLPPITTAQPNARPSRPPTRPTSPTAVIILGILGCLIFSWIVSLVRGDKGAGTQTAETAPHTSSDSASYGKSAARERLENKIHTQAIVMLGLEDTTVITSQDKLLVKIPRLTQRDVMLESENYRPILRSWMRVLQADFAAAGVTNVCVYESAWDGLKICANPAGER